MFARVDSLNGRVYHIRNGVKTYTIDDLDTAEKAIAHDIDEYIRLDYHGLPEKINLTESVSIHYDSGFLYLIQ